MKKIIYVLIFLFFLTGCRSISLTTNDFINQAEYNGYIVQKNKTGYEKYVYIKDIYYAIQRENAYDIQFLELENEEYSKKFFEINYDELENKRMSNSYVKKINRRDYNVYHLETNTNYYLVLRCQKNIIYIDAPIGYINEIEEFLKDLQLEY